MKKIKDLRVGELDAQYYLRNPDSAATELFRRAFYKSVHLQKLHDPDTYFFIGEKGTGKTSYTAYSLLFMQEEFKASSAFFNADDFALFKEVAIQLGVTQSQYPSLWNFVFIVLLLDGASQRYEFKAEGPIRSFLQAASDVSFGAKFNNFERALKLLGDASEIFSAYAEYAGLNFNQKRMELAAPNFKIDRMIDDCIGELAEYGEDYQFCLFVDSIDVRPEQLEYSDYLEIVTGLCNGAWVLNATQLSRISPSFKVVLMLRPDIFEAVPFQNRSTKLATHAHLVDWSTRYNVYRDSELFKMTDWLFHVQQSESNRARQGDTWNAYFPFRVDSRISDEGDDPFVLFLRHSFYKPRDIVKYLELMCEAYSNDERGERESFSDDVFSDRDIRQEFSNYLLLEIQDQAQFYYSMEEWQQFKDFNDGYLTRVINKRRRNFDYEGFVGSHKSFIEENRRNNRQTPETFQTADTLLQFMFDLNIIGFQVTKMIKDRKTGERVERTFTNWSFRQRSFANLKPKVPTGSTYVMHYGVAKALFTDFI